MSTKTDIIRVVDHEQWERDQACHDSTLAPLYQLLEHVKDPEIPALSIWDMGILRSITVSYKANNAAGDKPQVNVVITPTYSGCPAMDVICEDIYRVLKDAGYRHVDVAWQLSPAWTTAWMSEKAKTTMVQSGIAAPQPSVNGEPVSPLCPVCGSKQTVLVSEFGATACKALYRCKRCLEPFDYFKPF